jgi:transposase InsO family protein
MERKEYTRYTREFKLEAVRLSDITFIPTREGWLYLAAILDLYSRAIVGWDEQESRLPVG